MKSIFFAALVVVLAPAAGDAATQPIYINSAPLRAPTFDTPVVPVIDATAWWNRSLFAVTNGNFVVAGLPYEAFNNRFFTNTATTNMVFDPGVRFWRKTGTTNAWMDSWVNRGKIVTDHDTLSFGTFVSDSSASILQVASSNILSSGPLFSGTHGLIRLEGNRIDVSRTALRTGSPESVGFNFSGQFTSASNYVNDVGIRDLYWAVGRGDAVDGARSRTMPLLSTAFRPNFDLNSVNSVLSPFHEVIAPSSIGGRLQTNSTSVPDGAFISGGNAFIRTNAVQYHAIANQTILSATNSIIQVIFYPSNLTDPEFTTEARFFQFANEPATASVGFHAREFDIATRTTITNSVYLVDDLATLTNSFLSRNAAVPGLRRPNTFAVSRRAPFEYSLGNTGSVAYSTNLFYRDTYTRAAATNRYAAYAAQVELLSSSPSGSIPYNVTNAPGRVEILGDEVNLDQTRIRAESAVIIKAKNLVSNNLARVDAPLVNFDVRSVQPVFNVVNIAPATVRRFGGTVRAWSATWDNFEAITTGTNIATNTVTFHVLIVESQLRSTVPVTVNEFAVRATNVVLGDTLNIARSFVVEGNSLHITGGLTLPSGMSLTASNLLGVRNFTNDGIINIPGSAFYGTDRALSYSNWVNHGTNIASSIEIRTRNFENSGALVAGGGSFILDAVAASMQGRPLIESSESATNYLFDFFTFQVITNVTTRVVTVQSAPLIDASGDVELRARDLSVSNSVIRAGTLILNVTNRLADSGPEATNLWSTTAGFQALRRPTTSSMFGVHMRSTAPQFGIADHMWAGADMGNTNTAFTNNLALGKLTFDGGEDSLFRFAPVGASNALYVDYIELENWATNFNSAFSISPNFTIYFANANVPVTKLHGAAGGRFQWVRSFAGPLSSTNIYYASTSNTYTFNIALVTDNDLDTDGNGIVNGEDPEPIPVPEEVVLSASAIRAPDLRMLLRWNGIAYSRNIIEYTSGNTPGQWSLLTNLQMGPFNHPVTIEDPVGTNGEMRVYRLRVDLK